MVIALLLAAAVGGVTGGLSLEETFATLINGLGGQGETALSYILLGTLAVLVSRSGLTKKLIRRVMPLLRGRRAFVLFAIAGLASFSQNLVPVHIAFIPILIPPLLAVFDRVRIDRRGVATALTFGLKAPYLIVPLGFGLIFLLRAERWKDGDPILDRGVAMMGSIAFIMLVASGFADVLTETGAVDSLVETTTGWIGDSRLLAAVVMMSVGLLVTMGIGTSFGTVPVLAAIFVPMASAIGFSPLATAALIGASGAIGDAGAPVWDSTLGPTSGLNADGQHNHIWDTCVPTFLHYNIPLFFGGVLAAMVL